jgi:hypothetical protein
VVYSFGYMAPFNTHFLIAEKLWPEVKAMIALPETGNSIPYGQFCFGCVAPDVDKLSATLTQKDTHFFDRTTDYNLMASHRSVAFLKNQAEFLGVPFVKLPGVAQAFVLGYLCHLAVDEVSKHLWRLDTWLRFKPLHPGASFAALDEAGRQRIGHYSAIVEALEAIHALKVIPRIPPADMEQMLRGTRAFVQAADPEEEFLVLVDMFDRPTPEQRREKQEMLRLELDEARRRVHFFQIDCLVRVALAHARRRLADLINGRIPAPGYPALAGEE